MYLCLYCSACSPILDEKDPLFVHYFIHQEFKQLTSFWEGLIASESLKHRSGLWASSRHGQISGVCRPSLKAMGCCWTTLKNRTPCVVLTRLKRLECGSGVCGSVGDWPSFVSCQPWRQKILIPRRFNRGVVYLWHCVWTYTCPPLGDITCHTKAHSYLWVTSKWL